MRFDIITKRILNEGANVAVGIPEILSKRRLDYENYPEECKRVMAQQYIFIRDYNMASYPSTDKNARIPIDKKIVDALNVIRYVVQNSTDDEFEIDGDMMSRRDLIRSSILLCSRFGDHEGAKRPDAEQARSLRGAIFGNDDDDMDFKKKKRRNEDVVGKYTVKSNDLKDIDGNPIPINTKLAGADYRLSTIRETENVTLYGGIEGLHQIYKVLLPMVDLKHQITTRREERGREVTLYYWGENYLPYRTVAKLNAQGLFASREVKERHNEERKQGGVFWDTDTLFNKKKARPLTLVGPEGVYQGNMLYNLGEQEVREKLEGHNFDKYNEEVDRLLILDQDELKKLYKKQQDYLRLDRESKIKHYFEIHDKYIQDRGEKRNLKNFQPPMGADGLPVGFPYFCKIVKLQDGTYEPETMTPEEMYNFLYPKEQFPDLYTER